MTAKKRFVHVGFHFGGKAPPVAALEKVFNGAKDWLRYSDHCWVLYTGVGMDVWRDRIHKVVGEEAVFLLVEFDKGKTSGYMTDFAWEWLAKPRE